MQLDHRIGDTLVYESVQRPRALSAESTEIEDYATCGGSIRTG
jgi:hypothetical protein